MTENEAIKYLECFEDWNEDDEWLRRDIMEEFTGCDSLAAASGTVQRRIA